MIFPGGKGKSGERKRKGSMWSQVVKVVKNVKLPLSGNAITCFCKIM